MATTTRVVVRQVQAQRKAAATPPAVGRQVSEDDEISRIKKQNKNAAQVPAAAAAAAVSPVPETVEERPPQSVHARDEQLEETARKTPISR